MSDRQTLYTIGHSNRSFEDFLALLKQYDIRQLVDIRTLPGSKRYPHFDKENLARLLPAAGIEYHHLLELGGRRHALKHSQNTGWEHPAFRGYADYMQTREFKTAVETLSKLAKSLPTVIMCSEAVPWRCHRSMVGDALLIREFVVLDIISKTSASPHKLTPWAQVNDLEITYPAPVQQMKLELDV